MRYGAYPGLKYEGPDPQPGVYWYNQDPQQADFSSSFSGFSQIFFERFRQRPIRYLFWYTLEKPYFFWRYDLVQGGHEFVYAFKKSLYDVSSVSAWTQKASRGLHPLIMIVSVFGIFFLLPLLLNRTREAESYRNLLFFMAIPLLYFTAIYMVFCPLPRYSIPLRPFLYIWFAGVLYFLPKPAWLTGNIKPKVSTTAVSIVIAGLFFIISLAIFGQTYSAKTIPAIKPDFLNIKHVGTSYLNTRGEKELDKKEPEKASTYFLQAVSLWPDNYRALGNLGIAEMMAGRPAKALEWIKKGLCVKDQSASLWYFAAKSLAKTGHVEETVACLRKALQIDPKFKSARNDLNALDEQLKQIISRVSLSEKSKLTSENLLVLGHLYFMRRDFQNAAICMEEVLAQKPDNLEALVVLARAYGKTGDFDKANGILSRAGKIPGQEPLIALESLRLLCLEKKQAEATALLVLAHEKGYKYTIFLLADDDFRPLYSLPSFMSLVKADCEKTSLKAKRIQ